MCPHTGVPFVLLGYDVRKERVCHLEKVDKFFKIILKGSNCPWSLALFETMIWMLRLQRKHENNRNRSRTHITPIDERILQL